MSTLSWYLWPSARACEGLAAARAGVLGCETPLHLPGHLVWTVPLPLTPFEVSAGFHSWLLVPRFSLDWQGKCCHTFELMPITPVLNKKMHMLIMSLAGPSLGPDITCSMSTLSNTGCSLRLALGSAGSVSLNSLTYVSCSQIASALQESLHTHLALFLHAQVLVRAGDLMKTCSSPASCQGAFTSRCVLTCKVNSLVILVISSWSPSTIMSVVASSSEVTIFTCKSITTKTLGACNRGGLLATSNPVTIQLCKSPVLEGGDSNSGMAATLHRFTNRGGTALPCRLVQAFPMEGISLQHKRSQGPPQMLNRMASMPCPCAVSMSTRCHGLPCGG